jgi:hypothetical protein
VVIQLDAFRIATRTIFFGARASSPRRLAHDASWRVFIERRRLAGWVRRRLAGVPLAGSAIPSRSWAPFDGLGDSFKEPGALWRARRFLQEAGRPLAGSAILSRSRAPFGGLGDSFKKSGVA